ncbi:hypothetical protein ACIBEJ_10495 [Nonomuraea sp. NPDC050790]|uniref:hypothetical protein n=1 Tax=Nonomuraea sp. NPDC050790 TaxID=3364371 RepID=UPI0037A05A8C
MSRELCEHYGPHLYDYCRTELGESDAELAAAGTLLTASAYAGQVADPAAWRPWLYALARAHRAARAAARPASTGSWARSSRTSDLLPEAMIALDGPYRELLDLSVRHRLPHAEIALLFDVPETLIDATVREAAWRLETWLAAVTAARSGQGCAQLGGRVAEWAAAPSRSTRARLGRHLYGCVSCLAAPRGLPAARLLTDLPIASPRGPLSDLLPLAVPLAVEAVGWRADGFPVQAHGLGGAPHARLADGAALATTPPSALTPTPAASADTRASHADTRAAQADPRTAHADTRAAYAAPHADTRAAHADTRAAHADTRAGHADAQTAHADRRVAFPLNTPVADPTTATGAGVRPGAGAAAPGRIPSPSDPDLTPTDTLPRLSPTGMSSAGPPSAPLSANAPISPSSTGASSGTSSTSALSGSSSAEGWSGTSSTASPEGVSADHTFSGRASGDTPGEATGIRYLDALIEFGAGRGAAPDAETTDPSMGPMAGPPLGFGGPARSGGSSHAGHPGRGHPYATPVFAAPVYGAEPDEPPTPTPDSPNTATPSPSAATPGNATPGTAASGSAASGIGAPGGAAPESAAPGTATPGIAAPGAASPGTEAPDAASRGTSLRSTDFHETDPGGGALRLATASRAGAVPPNRDAALLRRDAAIPPRDAEPHRDTEPAYRDTESSRRDTESSRRDTESSRRDTESSRRDGADAPERDPYALPYAAATPEEPLAEDEFRAWERRGAKWEEFWKDRPDEADPEARISVRSVARVGLLVGAGVLVAGLAWSGIHARPRPTTVSEAAAPVPRPVITLSEPGSDPEVEVPPQENPVTVDPGQVIPERTAPPTTGSTGTPADPDDGATRKPSDTRSSDDSPDPPREPTTSPTRQPTKQPTKSPTKQPSKQPTKAPDRGSAKESAQPMAKKVELPKPPPPSARLSSSSASLGSGRSGSFALDCDGSCKITSASGSNGISVSGSSYTVGAPASRPGCPGAPTSESGTITVSWSGTRTGDGSSTAGTTSGSGTLTMSVSWTVAKDKGTFVPDMKGGGYWSNCSPNSGDDYGREL